MIDQTLTPGEREAWHARLRDPETWLALKATAEKVLGQLRHERHRGIRATARAWLRTLGREPKSDVRLKLSAETAAIAAFYLREFGPLPEHGDAGNARSRLLYLLEDACAHGQATEYRRTAPFRPYVGPKR